MSDRTLSSRFLDLFVETAASELGQEKFFIVLENAGLSLDRSNPARLSSLNGGTAAQTYAGFCKKPCVPITDVARGILMRVGSNMWRRLLGKAPLGMKAQSKLFFGLPVNARRKPALELLAKLLADQRGDVTVHTLDLDLLFVDKASLGTLGQKEPERICSVTLGLLRE